MQQHDKIIPLVIKRELLILFYLKKVLCVYAHMPSGNPEKVMREWEVEFRRENIHFSSQA